MCFSEGHEQKVVRDKKGTEHYRNNPGENIIFNITPSPGASVCLKNAENDAHQVVKFMGKEYSFDFERFRKDY